MKKVQSQRHRSLICRAAAVVLFFFTTYHSSSCVVIRTRGFSSNITLDLEDFPPVQLHMLDNHVVMDNGLVNVTVSIPGGMITSIVYNGIDNILQNDYYAEDNRGYWDVVWSQPDHPHNIIDKLEGSRFDVVIEEEDQLEISFLKTYDDSSVDATELPINIDKRFIMLRGSPGFYSYAIFERLEGWRDIDVYQGRIVFKLQDKLFKFMAVGDERQRIMPTSGDRERGQPLDYPEAVLLTDPANSLLKGEVDDKYQYSSDNKENQVHGWICASPPTGFWMVTPSNEFKTAGPVKQDLTSHAGPITLSMFFSTHYAGPPLGIKFRDGEIWKKVFGPVFIYLNSISEDSDPLSLWADAKEQMLMETESWPYDFPRSQDFPVANQRGIVSGRLLVNDSYINERLITGSSAYVGLAPPGDVGSWQSENKGYQFWTKADTEGYFVIKNVREGNYSLYAWVPGFIGDYKFEPCIYVSPGKQTRLGYLIYSPPRIGPTIWEIGIPDRTALEFFVPDPSPKLMNQLYTVNPSEKFRQYGLWDRYTELYQDQDLVFTVGVNNYQTDWFFAHVNRYQLDDSDPGNKTYEPTTWQIAFDLESVNESANYAFFLALASANEAELQPLSNEMWNSYIEFVSKCLKGFNSDPGNKTYEPTTWQIAFDLESVNESANYALFLALASANEAELQIRVNDPKTEKPHFTTGLIGRDNAIARHGIHGLYWLYDIQIYGSQLLSGRNIISLTQSRGSRPWNGLMYDYIRFEGPP